MDISHSLHTEVTSLSFSFLSTEDVRSISVKKVDNPILLDNLNLPTKGGLYDPKLGPMGPRDVYVGSVAFASKNRMADELYDQLRNMPFIILHMSGSFWTYRAPYPCLSAPVHESMLSASPVGLSFLPSLQNARDHSKSATLLPPIKLIKLPASTIYSAYTTT